MFNQYLESFLERNRVNSDMPTQTAGWHTVLTRQFAPYALIAVILPPTIWIAMQISALTTSTGVRLPWEGHESDYLAGLGAALVLGAFILIAPVRERNRLPLLLVWVIKCFVVLGFMLVYESQYDVLDAYSYHEQARLGEYAAADLTWGAGTQLVTHALQLLYEVLPPSYHMAKVLFAFMGLVGIYLVYRGWSIYTGDQSRRLFFILVLFPGILFWSSILGKEPVLIFSMGLYVYGLAYFLRRRQLVGLFLVCAAVILAGAIRPWMAIILSIPLGMGVFISSRGPKKKWLILIIFASALVASIPLLDEYAAVSLRLDAINQMSRGWSEGGAAQTVPEFGSYQDVAAFLPLGAFTALFRPLPGEIMNAFGLMASLESLLLLGMMVLGVMHWRQNLLKDLLYVMLCSLVIVWAIAYGLVSYQNLGTAVRFRAQILPVLLVVLWWPLWYRKR